MEKNDPQYVEAVRRFNRFYTRQIGVLTNSYLHSPFSLTEARVIYELAHHEATTATEIGSELDLDAGHLSRILRDFHKQGLIEKKPGENDARQSILRLTDEGREAFAQLNSRSHNGIKAMLDKLPAADHALLVDAMATIEKVLGAQSEQRVPYILRPHQPGDMGWVVHRHGVLYSKEYGWDEHFEALVASIVSQFIENYDPRRERCWIAEIGGEIVGSVFLVKQSETVGKLRLMYVEPRARGLGIGKHLVEECIRFARQTGYKKITLWTNSVLTAARHIYDGAGFRIIYSAPFHGFGHDLIEETWELEL